MEAKSPVVGNKLPIFNPLVSLVVVVAVGEVVILPVDDGGLGFSQAANKKPLAMVAILKARETRIFAIENRKINHTSEIFTKPNTDTSALSLSIVNHFRRITPQKTVSS
jgi:hypothetical protein